MTDYDTMSVHELVAALVYAPDNVNIHVRCMHDYSQDHDIIESALRKAVIREASVGVIAVPRYGNGEITIDIDEADYVASADDGIEGHHRALIESIKKRVPGGSYYLIPKETT